MNIIRRIGTFFILLGLVLITLFVLSDIAKTPTCNFLVVGAVSLIVGIIMQSKDPVKRGPRPERFRSLRTMMNNEPKDEKQHDHRPGH